MPSKPLAYGLFVVACIASAGGGAYFALRQQGGSSAPAAPLSAGRASVTRPQPVVPVVTPTTSESSPLTPTPRPLDAKTARGPALEKRVQAPPASLATRQASPKRQAEETLPPERPSIDQAGASAPQPRGVDGGAQPPDPGSPPSQGVDSGSAAQRPWPGPPASQPQFQQTPPSSGAIVEPARTEPDSPVGQRSGQWEEVVVPSESVIGLEFESTINTEYARVEDLVEARVTRDVRVGGRVAIPAGTLAIGSVTMVERGGPMKTRARLGFRFHTLIFADRSRVSIATDTVYRMGESPGNQSSAKIGGAAIGGAIIGAILGGGKGAAIGSGIGAAGGAAAAMHGGRIPVVVPAGTTLSVRTQASFTLTVEK